MSTQAKKLTFKAWQALPQSKQRYEIVDEKLIMPPSPTSDHQWIAGRIFLHISIFVDERGLGVVLAAPLDIVIRQEPLRVRQPDVLYLSAERTGITRRADLQAHPILEIPPDLVVEVLSPSNTRGGIADKLEDYRRFGVRECWLVDPENNTLEVLGLSPAGIAPEVVYGVEDTLRSGVLDGLELPLRQIFE